MLRNLVYLVLAIGLFGASSAADELNPVRHHPHAAALPDGTVRVIVKLRQPPTSTLALEEKAGDDIARLASSTGMQLKESRRLSSDLRVVEIDPQSTAGDAEAALERLRADPAVAYAEPDRRRYLHAVPNDPLYPGQWYLQNAPETPSAIDAEAAWDLTPGSNGVVIAVIDSGVRFDHPDLLPADSGGRLLPGFDFVSDASISNDGDGLDDDASDPGDWVTQTDAASSSFSDCSPRPSSWHGTRIAGIIGAIANNSVGLSGGSWNGWILPVRVLGKCGGYDSDILAGMLWAGGLPVSGAPDNPYPANVENLSVGSTDNCPQSYRDVIGELAAAGVLVVVSSGNEGGLVDAPANCAGVAAVAGLRHAGTKVGYSNLGPAITLGAPAGNCVNLSGACIYSIDTTSNTGSTGPETNYYTDQLDINVGTSFSAPVVATIAGLMLAVNGNLGSAQLISRLQEGAKTPFPVSSDSAVPQCHVPAGPSDLQLTECNCTTSTCGAGMANALGAVTAALRPIAAIAVPATVSPGQDVTLSGAGSRAACGFGIASYDWTITSGGVGVGISSTSPDSATVIAPTSGSLTVQLTVTDDTGRTDSAEAVIEPNLASTTAPALAGDTACLIDRVPPAVLVRVVVSPSGIALRTNATQSFAATVTNATDTSVTWQVNGIPGGDATVGSISVDGLYTAPRTVPTGGAVIVTAVSAEDPSRSGSASVSIFVPPSRGGGGSVGWIVLAGLLAALLVRRRSAGQWFAALRTPRCRARTARASRSSTATESSQPMQPSVMLWP